MFVYMALSPAWPVDAFRATVDRILRETGLSQAALAALVPMDQSQLSRWKSGSSRPKFESLVTLGEALRTRYPHLAIGPNDLLEAAGYAAPGPVARVAQVNLRTPAPNDVVISAGGSTTAIPINPDEPEPDPNTYFEPPLNERERMIWAMELPWQARVASIEGLRTGLKAARERQRLTTRRSDEETPDIGRAASEG